MIFAKTMTSRGAGPRRMVNGDVQENTRDGFPSLDHASYSAQQAVTGIGEASSDPDRSP
jgi:hypothetical protein